jgi:hypothetical protein
MVTNIIIGRNAFLLLSHQIMLVKNNRHSTPPKNNLFKNNSPKLQLTKAFKPRQLIGIGVLVLLTFNFQPPELHLKILNYLEGNPKCLYNCSLLNSYWLNLATPTLYHNSTLTSPRSIQSYISQLQQEDNLLKMFVKKLTFTPSNRGSLIDPLKDEDDIESISKAHTSLFRYLVHNRNLTNSPVPSDIFYTFAKILPKLEMIEETDIVA